MRNKSDSSKERIERPMSWEGELSDTEEILQPVSIRVCFFFIFCPLKFYDD